MRFPSFHLLLALLFATPLFGAATTHDHAGVSATTVYQCSMHPWIKSDRPGKCTVCGMDLAAVTAANAGSTALNATGVVTLPATSIAVIGVQTATVTRQPLVRTLRVAGRIEDDDTRHRILSARVPGRVEKLFVNYVGASVEAGAPLATLWSPEALTAERVYTERLRGGEIAFSASERSAAREQLQQLGLSDVDIAHLEETREPSAIVTVRAPVAGIVVAKSVYEGQYVQSSDRLFEIADFSRMWFVFDAYAQDIPWLHVGQSVEVTTRAVPGEVITSTIEFIDPNFDDQRQTTRVRAILPNPHYSVDGVPHNLPHRVLAEGRVLVETPAVLAAPRSAILDTGGGPVAYVALANHSYQQRKLELGRRGDASVEILSGLTDGEQVVTEGNLLIDAQAQLTREAGAHGGAMPPPRVLAGEVTRPPSDISDPLAALAQIAVDAGDALASDDYARYVKLLPQLAEAAKPFDLPPLEPGENLKTARASFEPWSTRVAALVSPHRGRLGLKIFQCPMSPVLHKGRWVQRSLPLKNPFFGSAMPDCGEEIR
jgi:Cu(I)/Ag(I) efflux system membrane fusion protein